MTYYDAIARGYYELHGTEQQQKMHIIHALLEEFQIHPSFVLDIGCGTGISMKGFPYCIGIDPSLELLKQAEGTVIQGIGQQLPFGDQLFDVVCCVTALHHMQPFEQTLKEIKRVGKKWFIFSLLHTTAEEILPSIQHLFTLKKIIREQHDTILLCQRWLSQIACGGNAKAHPEWGNPRAVRDKDLKRQFHISYRKR